MNIIDTLREPVLLLPKRNDKETFPELLSEIYSNFLDAISKIDQGTIADEIKKNEVTIKAFCEKLIQSATTYYNGYPPKAYFEFEKGMNLIDGTLFPEKPSIVLPKYVEPFYRARLGGTTQFERKEMFHIPFEKREYVTTQRFSVPGLPCLYLSNSVYVCWEELRRPDINKMQVSRMRLENYRFNFLDLSLTPDYLSQMLDVTTSDEFLQKTSGETKEQALDGWNKMTLGYLMIWPLVAACSIEVRQSDATFKPEYIFPQFLLQWVTQNKKIDGIKYFSIAANTAAKVDQSRLINYAIPVKQISPRGLCKELADSFSLTEAISWEMLSISNPSIVQHNHQKFSAVIQKLSFDTLIGTLELIKGRKVSYWHTVFGKLEMELADMDHEIINVL